MSLRTGICNFFHFGKDHKYYYCIFPVTVRLDVSPDARSKDQSQPKKGFGKTWPGGMWSEVFGDDEACVGFEVMPVQITRG